MKTKSIILIIIGILTILYIIITFPRNIIENDRIVSIDIIYIDNVSGLNSSNGEQTKLQTTKELNDFKSIIEKYKYRKYFLPHDISSRNDMGLILFTVIYENGKGYPLQIYSDGEIYDGTKGFHIGLIGKDKAKDMYNDILKYLKDDY